MKFVGFVGYVGLLALAALIVARLNFPDVTFWFTISNTKTIIGGALIFYAILYTLYFWSVRNLHHWTENSGVGNYENAERFAKRVILFQKSLVAIQMTLLTFFVIYALKFYQQYTGNDQAGESSPLLVIFTILSILLILLTRFSATDLLSQRIGYLQSQFREDVDPARPEKKELLSPNRYLFWPLLIALIVLTLYLFFPALFPARIAALFQ